MLKLKEFKFATLQHVFSPKYSKIPCFRRLWGVMFVYVSVGDHGFVDIPIDRLSADRTSVIMVISLICILDHCQAIVTISHLQVLVLSTKCTSCVKTLSMLLGFTKPSHVIALIVTGDASWRYSMAFHHGTDQ